MMLFKIVKIHASRKIILWFIFFGYILFASASFINEAMNTKEHVCIESIIAVKDYEMLLTSLL